MTRAQVWLSHMSNLIVTFTGIIYFVMLHFMTSDDAFSVVNHPLQPLVQHVHVLAAPLLTFAIGIIWTRHAAPRAKRSDMPTWRSGIVLMAVCAPMIASGYLLQVSTEAEWRKVWMWLHVVSSVVWMLGYVSHVWRWVMASFGSRPKPCIPIGQEATHVD